MSEAKDRYYDFKIADGVWKNQRPPIIHYSAVDYVTELEQQNDYLIEALIKEVKQSYEDTGSYSNFSMQVIKNITKKPTEEILVGGER